MSSNVELLATAIARKGGTLVKDTAEHDAATYGVDYWSGFTVVTSTSAYFTSLKKNDTDDAIDNLSVSEEFLPGITIPMRIKKVQLVSGAIILYKEFEG